MRRLMVLVTVVLLMTAMLVVATAEAAEALQLVGRVPFGSQRGTAIEPTSACETLAGVAAFEWRSGGQACWITFPAQDAFSNVEPLL
jgi:hypothetical protein